MYHTIPGFEEMTAQQIYDMSASHLLKQNEKSVTRSDGGETCQYRSGKLMCAAGVFLTDKGANRADNMYDSETGAAWDEVVRARIAPDTHKELVRHLQEVHDYYDLRQWPKKLIDLAKYYDLNDDVVTKRINE